MKANHVYHPKRDVKPEIQRSVQQTAPGSPEKQFVHFPKIPQKRTEGESFQWLICHQTTFGW